MGNYIISYILKIIHCTYIIKNKIVLYNREYTKIGKIACFIAWNSLFY